MSHLLFTSLQIHQMHKSHTSHSLQPPSQSPFQFQPQTPLKHHSTYRQIPQYPHQSTTTSVFLPVTPQFHLCFAPIALYHRFKHLPNFFLSRRKGSSTFCSSHTHEIKILAYWFLGARFQKKLYINPPELELELPRTVVAYQA